MASRGYRSGSEAKYADTVGLDADDDDEDNDIAVAALGSGSSKEKRGLAYMSHEEGLSISATTFIAGTRQTALPGGPFSAVTPSMWPQDILTRLQQLEECRDQPEYRYDEFGFKVSKFVTRRRRRRYLLGASLKRAGFAETVSTSRIENVWE